MNSPGKDQFFGMDSPRKAVVSPQKNKKIDIEKNQLSSIWSNVRSHSERLQESQDQVRFAFPGPGGVIRQKVVLRQVIKNQRHEIGNLGPSGDCGTKKRTD